MQSRYGGWEAPCPYTASVYNIDHDQKVIELITSGEGREKEEGTDVKKGGSGCVSTWHWQLYLMAIGMHQTLDVISDCEWHVRGNRNSLSKFFSLPCPPWAGHTQIEVEMSWPAVSFLSKGKKNNRKGMKRWKGFGDSLVSLLPYNRLATGTCVYT